MPASPVVGGGLHMGVIGAKSVTLAVYARVGQEQQPKHLAADEVGAVAVHVRYQRRVGRHRLGVLRGRLVRGEADQHEGSENDGQPVAGAGREQVHRTTNCGVWGGGDRYAGKCML